VASSWWRGGPTAAFSNSSLAMDGLLGRDDAQRVAEELRVDSEPGSDVGERSRSLRGAQSGQVSVFLWITPSFMIRAKYLSASTTSSRSSSGLPSTTMRSA
jgi:hypothetical protein